MTDVAPPTPAVPAPGVFAENQDGPERETSCVELLWDLVFVFAVTQVTTLLAREPSWGRFGQSMIVLALVAGLALPHAFGDQAA